MIPIVVVGPSDGVCMKVGHTESDNWEITVSGLGKLLTWPHNSFLLVN